MKDSPVPAVSVVVPVYNVEGYVRATLDSLVSQTLEDIEIICVDDGSTDSSLSVLEEYAASDPRIKVISQENQRQGGARNTGMAAASGKYVAFLDSDDTVDADYYEALYSAAESTSSDIAVSGRKKIKGGKESWTLRFGREMTAETVQEKYALCGCPPDFYITNMIYRAGFLRDAGIAFRKGVFYEDVAFFMKAFFFSGKAVYVQDIAYRYLVRGNSTTKVRQSSERQRNRYEALRDFVLFCDEKGIELPYRYRNVPVRYFSLGPVTLWKLRSDGLRKTLYLFDFIPLYAVRTNGFL